MRTVMLDLRIAVLAVVLPLPLPLQAQETVPAAEQAAENTPVEEHPHRPRFSGEAAHELQWNFDDEVNLDNQLSLSLEVPLWKGATFQAKTLHMAATHGPVVDDWQGYSNLSADNCAAAVAICDLEQQWHTPRAHITAHLGVRNTNEDYFATDLTLFFHHASLGCIPTVGCNYPMANYPTAGMGLTATVATAAGWTFRTCFYNGKGYNGWSRDDNPFLVKMGRDGVCNFTEAAHGGRTGYYALGVCSHSHMHHVDSIPQRCGSATIYMYIEQDLWRRGDQAVQLLAHFSQNTHRHSPCQRHAAVGAMWTNGKHSAGAVFNYADFLEGVEMQAEASYEMSINDTLTFHPAVQWIRTDGADHALAQARLTISF